VTFDLDEDDAETEQDETQWLMWSELAAYFPTTRLGEAKTMAREGRLPAYVRREGEIYWRGYEIRSWLTQNRGPGAHLDDLTLAPPTPTVRIFPRLTPNK
jgi:hypothetical protein